MTINWYVLKKYSCRCTGWPTLWIRHGSHCRYDQGVERHLSSLPRFIGGDCCLRALGHNTRRDACRNTGRPLRTARQPQGYGCTLPDLGVGMRVCMELECGRVL